MSINHFTAHVWVDQTGDLSIAVKNALDELYSKGYTNPNIQYSSTAGTYDGELITIFSVLITATKEEE